MKRMNPCRKLPDLRALPSLRAVFSLVSLLSLVFLLSGLSACNSGPETPAGDSTAHTTTLVQELASPTDSAAAEPYLFTDHKGTQYLSWIRKDSSGAKLLFSALRNGQWSEPQLIRQGKNWFVNWADYPLLASNGEGHLLAHYLEKSDSGTFTYDIRYTVSSDSGQSWSEPRVLHDDGKKAEHGFVSMVPHGEGYLLSWLDGRNAAMDSKGGDAHAHHDGHAGEMTIRAALLDKSGAKVSEWELDKRVCDCCQTGAVITDNGPVVIYRDRSAEEIRDISITRFVDGAWTPPQPIYADNWKIAGCPVNGARIDATGNTVAVAWYSAPEKDPQVKVVFSTDGGASFGQPIRIDEGKPIGRTDIVLLDAETALVSWMEGPTLKAVKVHRNGTKATPVTIGSSSESRASGFPQMTRSGSQVLFAWTDDAVKNIRLAVLNTKD